LRPASLGAGTLSLPPRGRQVLRAGSEKPAPPHVTRLWRGKALRGLHCFAIAGSVVGGGRAITTANPEPGRFPALAETRYFSSLLLVLQVLELIEGRSLFFCCDFVLDGAFRCFNGSLQGQSCAFPHATDRGVALAARDEKQRWP